MPFFFSFRLRRKKGRNTFFRLRRKCCAPKIACCAARKQPRGGCCAKRLFWPKCCASATAQQLNSCPVYTIVCFNYNYSGEWVANSSAATYRRRIVLSNSLCLHCLYRYRPTVSFCDTIHVILRSIYVIHTYLVRIIPASIVVVVDLAFLFIVNGFGHEKHDSCTSWTSQKADKAAWSRFSSTNAKLKLANWTHWPSNSGAYAGPNSLRIRLDLVETSKTTQNRQFFGDIFHSKSV